VSEVKTSAIATFAAQLKAWRTSRGWSQVDLADKLGYSDSLVSGVENGKKAPTQPFSERCDDAFGTPGTFAALQEMVSREAWPSYFAPVIDFERVAVRVHEWELRVVPGLLQTESYARCVIRAGKPGLSDDELDRKVTARLERQETLTREQPPLYWVVVSEGALRQEVGGAEVMREQLDKVLSFAARPGVVLQVLPLSATDHPGSDGPISVYDFQNGSAAGYCECKGGGMITESPDGVGELVTTMGMIRAVSMPPRGSLDMLRQIRSTIG
jgi:transcriptional regulator with XRE-family HTH domain